MTIKRYVSFAIVALALLWPSPAAAQAASGQTTSPAVIVIDIGGGYDTVQHAQVQGEALVIHPRYAWSIGGGLGIHGDARIEGGIHLPISGVDGIPKFTIGVSGFFVAPASPFETDKSLTAAGAAFVVRITPLFKITGEYIHSASPGFRSGIGWSAVFLLPFFTNAD